MYKQIKIVVVKAFKVRHLIQVTAAAKAKKKFTFSSIHELFFYIHLFLCHQTRIQDTKASLMILIIYLVFIFMIESDL